MPDAATSFDVRTASEHARVIDIEGDITAASEDVLMDAYARASEDGVRVIVLSFAGLEYMNSGGIGLLVTLLVRAQRQRQRVLAYGLSDHYRQIFELTRLDEAVGIHDNEADALEAAR
jgi:anti-sigma B factor antagonist